ncbi:MAG: hypothetical protein RMJ59_06015 [Candidatus Nitrosocaldus sp.]|nr:hypothetical protein [Candidatus Nitrosocaldus sp.]MDW8275919.1 hypothetical protein [Candidatus Nitrosocaldus sp.]
MRSKSSRNLDKAAAILNYILANMADMKDKMDDEDMELMVYLTERIAKLYNVDVEELIKVQTIHIREARMVVKMLREFLVSVKK